MPFDSAGSGAAPEGGLSWGPLALPAGTRVWTRFRDEDHEGEVAAGVVEYRGGSLPSVNGFCNAVFGRPTNAWSVVWVLRPGLESDFRLADDLRAEARGAVVAPRARPVGGPRVRRGPAPPPPVSLVSFLIKSGGLRDQGGDVLAVMGRGSARPGLLNNRSGRALDEAGMLALEAGYFPEHEIGDRGGFSRSDPRWSDCGRAVETMTVSDLLEAVDEELRRGRKRFPGGALPGAGPAFDSERDEADRSAADREDAEAFRSLLALAREEGSGAALARLVVLAGCEPALEDAGCPF